MAENKKPETVDEYVQNFPAKTQEVLQQLREFIKEIAPEANEVISYAIPGYKLPGQGRAFVYISAYPKHVSIYPRPQNAPHELEKELEPYAAGKGTLRFSLSEPLPEELIKHVVTQLYLEAKS